MNKGLNRKCTYFKKEVGSSGTFAANLNKNEGGFYILLSGYETPGLSPIAFNLYFSSFNLNSTSAYGAAIRESYYYELTDDYENLRVYLKDSFGSIKEYHFVTDANEPGIIRRVFECSEDHSRIERDTYDILPDIYYNLFDKYGNKIILLKNRNYPVEIVYKSGERYTFSSRRNITNNLGTTLEISTDYRTITFKKETTEIYKIELVVENNLLTKIIHKKPIVSDTETTYEILYTNEYIVDTTNKSVTIIDGLSNYRVKFNYTEINDTYLLSSYIESYTDEFDESIINTITYNDNYTRVLNYLGEYIDYYFGSNNLLEKQINSLGQLELYTYDANGYLSSKTININHSYDYASRYSILSGYFNVENIFTSSTNLVTTLNTVEANPYADKIGDKVFTISNYSTDEYCYVEKAYVGKKDDYLTLSLWSVKNFSYTGPTLNIILELINEAEVVETYTFSVNNSNWGFNVFEIKAGYNFTKVKLTLSPTNGGSYHINAVNLIPSSAYIYYSYDSNGNLLTSSYMKNNSSNKYSDNLLIQKYQTGSKLFNLMHNENGLVTREIASNGLVTDIAYNSDNQVLSNKISFNDKYIENSNTYENGFIKTKTDEVDSVMTYNVDSLTGKVNKITDELSNYKEYTYDNIDNITKLKVGNFLSNKVEYIYKTYKKVPVIDKVKLDNGSTYEYIYDDYERVVGIDYYNINNITDKKRLITYTYEDKDGLPNKNIKSIQKYNNDYIEKYDYDNFNNVTRIYYSAYMTGGAISSYTYDENKKLTKEVIGTYERNYLYDAYGRIQEINDTEGSSFNYRYNQKNEVTTKKEVIQDKTVYYEYETRGVSRNSTLESNINEIVSSQIIYSTFFNDYESDGSISKNLIRYDKVGSTIKKYSKACVINTDCVVNTTTFNNIRCFDLTDINNQAPIYTLKESVAEYPQQSICFWIYPTVTFDDSVIFQTVKNQTNLQNNMIKAYFDNNKVKVELYQDEIKEEIIIGSVTSTKEVQLNKWQFISISWMSRQDDPTSPDVFTLRLTVDDDFVYYEKNNPRFYITQCDNQPFIIGNDFTYNKNFIGYIGPVMLADEEYLIDSRILELYYKSRSYIVNPQFKNEVEILTRFEDNSKAAYTYPLNNNLNSLTGNKPYKYIKKDDIDYDSNDGFVYNDIIKRYAFSLNGSLLQYEIDLSNGGPSTTGSIKFRFYIEEDYPKQVLFEYNTKNNVKVTLYRNENKNLVYAYQALSSDEVLVNTGITIGSRSWYEFGFSYYSTSTTSSIVNIMVNAIWYQYTTPLIFENGGIFTIGRSEEYNDLLTAYDPFYTGCKPLYGLIEQLQYSYNVLPVTNPKYSSDYTVKNYTNEFNEFGLKTKEINIKNEEVELVKEYTYKEENDSNGKIRISPVVEKETFIFGENTYEINYEYDRVGRLQRIIYPNTYPDNANLREIYYSYSERNELIDEYDVDSDTSYYYDYDDNGNIKEIIFQENADAGNETTLFSFTYDTTYPDRLIKVNRKEIKYDSVNHLCPVSYGLFDSSGNQTSGYTFTWDDTLLTGVTLDQKEITFEYDKVSKLRKKKIVDGVTTLYYYNDNNLLVKEVSPDIEKEYIYDINNSIKELIITKNSIKYRYLYLKDLLGNVIGLLDENLTIVARYKFRAYGEIIYQNTTVTTPFNLLEENPFMYRGYYYDRSIDMYYCHTRYYNVELCRWISPDSVDYLEPLNINGMNLYTFTKNNPLRYKYVQTINNIKYNIGNKSYININNLTTENGNVISENNNNNININIDYKELVNVFLGIIGSIMKARFMELFNIRKKQEKNNDKKEKLTINDNYAPVIGGFLDQTKNGGPGVASTIGAMSGAGFGGGMDNVLRIQENYYIKSGISLGGGGGSISYMREDLCIMLLDNKVW